MSIQNHSNYAIRGTTVVNFTLADSTVTGINGTLVNVDSAVQFANLTGTASFPRDTISGGYRNNLDIKNTTGSLTLTVGGNTAADATTIGLNQTNGSDGIYMETNGGGTITASVKNNTFNGAPSDMIQAEALGGTVNLTLSSNQMNNTHSNIAGGGGGLVIGASNGTMNATISGNTITGAVGNAISVASDLANGVFNGTISGNTIGNANAGSGSSTAQGIDVDANQGGVLKVNVANNTIQHFKQNGMRVIAGDCIPNNVPSLCGNNALVDVTVQGNTLSNRDAATPGSNWNGIRLRRPRGRATTSSPASTSRTTRWRGRAPGPTPASTRTCACATASRRRSGCRAIPAPTTTTLQSRRTSPIGRTRSRRSTRPTRSRSAAGSSTRARPAPPARSRRSSAYAPTRDPPIFRWTSGMRLG